MPHISKARGLPVLIIGDVLAYFFSLVLTLAVRYGEIPGRHLLAVHVPSFMVLTGLFLIVNFSAGLYDKQITVSRSRLEFYIVRVQIINALIGVIFFYFAPVEIAPKANLLIFFLISTALLVVWRAIMYPVVSASRMQRTLILGQGEDMNEMIQEIGRSPRYGITIVQHIEPHAELATFVATLRSAVNETMPTVIIADLHDAKIEAALPFLYNMIFSGIQVMDASRVYEDIFGRIPLSMVGERWLVEHSSMALGNRRTYDAIKRAMDIVVAGIGALVSLIFYPFIILAIKIDDHGAIFVTQERIGSNGKHVRIVKFRSMSGNDSGKYGAGKTTKNVVTRAGAFLRKSRLDELPQLWNVLKGDLSLVGPRPELPALTAIYEKEIPYYNVRHLVKPGLFGWAQIYHEQHPHHGVATEATRDKLSYDLYYIKNRSLGVDLKIMLRTAHILVSAAGK